jgi:hypothetical protein
MRIGDKVTIAGKTGYVVGILSGVVLVVWPNNTITRELRWQIQSNGARARA